LRCRLDCNAVIGAKETKSAFGAVLHTVNVMASKYSVPRGNSISSDKHASKTTADVGASVHDS